jgi:hypothetical protein
VAVLVAGTGVAIYVADGAKNDGLILMGFLLGVAAFPWAIGKAFLYIFSARCRGDKIKKPLFLSNAPGALRGVVAKCKSDNPERHQEGSGYHQPMDIPSLRAKN